MFIFPEYCKAMLLLVVWKATSSRQIKVSKRGVPSIVGISFLRLFPYTLLRENSIYVRVLHHIYHLGKNGFKKLFNIKAKEEVRGLAQNE